MQNVIVVPETAKYSYSVSHKNVVWVNKDIGKPDLSGRNVNYLVPYWHTDDLLGVTRIYHIKNVNKPKDGHTEITLGNSFVIECEWDNMGQHRKFEYHPLSDFGFHEIVPGILQPINQ